MDKNPLEHARLFDIWIWSNKPAIKKTGDILFADLTKHCRLKKSLELKRYKNHLKVILTDLFVAHRTDPKLYLITSRNKTDYTSTKRYKKIYLHPDIVANITDFLEKNKYIDLHIGVHFEHYKRMTRIRAKRKLIKIFKKHDVPGGKVLSRRPEVILRNAKKKDVDVPDTLLSKNLIKSVRRINRHISNYTISLDTPNIPKDFYEDYSWLEFKNYSKYTRVFNNSSFKFGGRFYHHWTQMIPSDLRKHILIDGKSTVELDYSCLHITMLYGLEGLNPPNGDLYALQGINHQFRPLIKKAFNIAINSDSKTKTLKAINHERREFDNKYGTTSSKAQNIINAIISTHPDLIHYFSSGYGLKLQNIDSRIAEFIMNYFLRKNICCLTIHDSFIVQKEYESDLRYIMKKIFYDMFEINIMV